MGCSFSTLFGFRWGRPPLNDVPEETPANQTNTNAVEANVSETTPVIATTTTATTTTTTATATESTIPVPATATNVETTNDSVTPSEVVKENESKPVEPVPFVRPAPLPSAISKIPPEVLLLILGMAADTPFVRRKIISVCSDWRKALVGISWVWTSIRIVSSRDTEVKFEKFLWNLTLQLERCGSLPINVYWRTCMDAAQTTQLFGLLAQKAPFSRWRTLELAAYDGSTLDNADVANMGDFQNLESFILCGSQVNCLLNLVNRSITSKLTNFDNRYLYMPLVQFRNEMDNLLKTITKFHLPYFSADADFELPANITELKVNILPDVPLPHVRVLTANSNSIRSYRNQNLRNLVTLDAYFHQKDDMDQPLTLSSLQNLTVHAPEFTALTLLTAPCLQTLRIEFPVQEGYKREINSMRQTLTHPSYSLSPYESLQLAAPLPLDLVERALMRSPRVMHLMFQIADCRKGWETIRRLFVEPPDWQRETSEVTIVTTQMLNKIETTTATMPSKKTVMVGKSKWWRLCPRLRTVRVELKWNWTEAEGTVWTSFLQRILEERFGGTLQSATCAWNNGTELTAVVVSG